LPVFRATAGRLVKHVHQPERLKPALGLNVVMVLLPGLSLAAGFAQLARLQ